MKKLFLLIGLVVFLTPMVVSAKENCFMCLAWPCKYKSFYEVGDILIIDNDYPSETKNWVKLNKKQCKNKIEINENTIIDIDTPDDLKTFEYWQACFHKWEGHPYRFEKDYNIKDSNDFRNIFL